MNSPRIFSFFRSKQFARPMLALMMVSMLQETFAPMQALALGGGPSQPEVESFEPIGTNQMVDLFTGDFNYNIPLMDVGGYPINIAYHAGIGMEQEASWVGLGWNLNPGVINRQLRGLADDMNGDEIKFETNMKTQRNYGFTYKVGPPGGQGKLDEKGYIKWEPNADKEVLGFKVPFGKSLDMGIHYNNYRGYGYSIGLSTVEQDQLSKPRGSREVSKLFSMSFSSSDGFVANPSVEEIGYALNLQNTKYFPKSKRLSLSLSSRGGLTLPSLQTRVGSYQLFGAKPTYTPTQMPNFYSFSTALDIGIGKNVPGFYFKDKFNGRLNYNQSGLSKNSYTSKALGYLYTKRLLDNDRDHVMDFNIYGSEILSRTNLKLPISQNTHDYYAISGQGNGGTFRPQLQTVFDFQDPFYRKIPSGNDLPLGIELGLGSDLKIGADLGFGMSWSKSKKWSPGFTRGLIEPKEQTDVTTENVYFKSLGEESVIDETFYAASGGDAVVSPKQNWRGFGSSIDLQQWKIDEVNQDVGELKRAKRDKRSQTISILTYEQMLKYGLERGVKNYQKTTNGAPMLNFINNGAHQLSFSPVGNVGRKDHHIGEITTLNPDGARYVYGLAAYNKTQAEMTFAVSQAGAAYFPIGNKENLTDFYDGSDDPNHDGDPSLHNNKGVDHYFNKVEKPAYAYSYLLTAVLSSDYIDRTQDGPSDDDFGNYTKFNYNLSSSDERWRVPYSHASHDQGLVSDELDDKGHISSGTKEVWHLHSIESKTHIAIFYTSKRKDFVSPSSSTKGNLGDANAEKLDRIVLYQKDDFKRNGLNAYKIKTVHFEYSYDLCGQVDNFKPTGTTTPHPLATWNSVFYSNYAEAHQGKLTLNKVYFTFGGNEKNKENAYVLEYKGSNPNYYAGRMDRWGGYKRKTGSYRDSDYPFVNQDKADTDMDVAAWCLTDITLPTGGHIGVTYESDDYAYVQDKQAMEMTPIKALTYNEDIKLAQENRLYNIGDDNPFNNVLIIDKPQDVNHYKQILNYENEYEDEFMYYSVLVNLQRSNSSTPVYERISGFARVKSVKLITSGDYAGKVAIALKGMPRLSASPITLVNNLFASGKINPISRNAFYTMKNYAPHIGGWGIDETKFNGSETEKLARTLFSFAPEMLKMAAGYEQYMSSLKYAQEVDLNQSYVRILKANKSKLGGGHRVKQITISDQWQAMGGEETASYGQNYSYTTTENGKEISSGVAQYEPVIGAEENPFKRPVNVKEIKGTWDAIDGGIESIFNFNKPQDHYLTIGPFVEELFPSPTVGYSKVSVKNIENNSTKKHNTGKVETEFYTAKDLPTIAEASERKLHIVPNRALQFIGNISIQNITASQGYKIINNDFHGKLKRQSTYQEYNSTDPISSTVYNYETKNNHVNVINEDGSIENRQIGIDFDMSIASKNLTDVSASFGVNLNTHTSAVPPTFFAKLRANTGFTSSSVKYITITKTLFKKTLLKSVTVQDKGSKLTTENLAWDAETGGVIATRTENEYGDWDYSLNQPAYWAYGQMGGAYKNIGAKMRVTVNQGEISNVNNLLTPGDELMVYRNGIIDNNGLKLWVLDVDKSLGKATLIKHDGTKADNETITVKVLRSGRKNLLGASMGGVVAKNSFTGGTSVGTGSEVINASATEYSDQWQTWRNLKACFEKPCDISHETVNQALPDGPVDVYKWEPADPNDPNNLCLCNYTVQSIINPYLEGVRGNWRAKNSYMYYDKSDANGARKVDSDVDTQKDFNETDTRKDGTIKGFIPFWLKPTVAGAPWYSNIPVQYTTTETLQITDPDGNGLQSIDANDIHSAALFGYNNKLPVAVAANASLQNILFDGFEDYEGFNMDVGCSQGQLYFNFFPSSQQQSGNSIALYDPCEVNRHWLAWAHLVNTRLALDNTVSHTGNFSLRIENTNDPNKPNTNRISVPEAPFNAGNHSTTASGLQSEYSLQSEDLVPHFNPAIDGTSSYLLSYWIKQESQTSINIADVKLETDQTGITITEKSRKVASQPIDGWVKVDVTYDITKTGSQANDFFMTITNTASTDAYLDDIRFQPVKSGMKSYVYDLINYRLMATLDDNNYATFYEYDEQGTLVRVKRETSKGIQTVKEARQSFRK